MSSFKRIIALLLAIVFIGTVLIGCKQDKVNEDPDNATEGKKPTEEKGTNVYGEETFSSVVPQKELDFEGEQLTILCTVL